MQQICAGARVLQSIAVIRAALSDYNNEPHRVANGRSVGRRATVVQLSEDLQFAHIWHAPLRADPRVEGKVDDHLPCHHIHLTERKERRSSQPQIEYSTFGGILMFYISMATVAFAIVLTAMQMEGRSGRFREGNVPEKDLVYLKLISISLGVAGATLILSRDFWR